MSSPQATIWNPDTGDKQVINTGGAMPQGYSLWTGGNASGQAARQAIMNAQKPATPQGSTPAVPAATLPTTLAPNNTIDSSTVNLGLNSGSVASSLPASTNTASSIYANGALDSANTDMAALQKQQDTFNATRLQETQNNLDNLQKGENTQISNYDTQNTPILNEANGIYKSELDAISKTNFSDLITQKQNLTKQITDYATMMNNELNTQNSTPGLESVMTGRSNAVISNYTSRIAIAKSALDAIDGNFTLANDTISNGAAAIDKILANRDTFIKTVKSIYDTPIANLTADEKTLLDQASKDIQTQRDNIQKNKDVINGLMTTNPVIANKAGLSLTDTPDQTAQKLNTFYTANPQYTPDNQTYIKSVMDKYPDAGITMNDPLTTVKAKLSQSPLYQKDVFSNQLSMQQNNLVYDASGKLISDISNATSDQIASAIKSVESGGNYNAKGASGENGAYQFMPGTWDSWSSQYNLQVNGKDGSLPMTPDNQDAIAKWKIQSWLDQGYAPDQIASLWNSGSPDYEGKVGTNNKGVNYDVPSYVDKVRSALAQQVGTTSTINAADALPPDPKTANVVDLKTGMTPNSIYQNAIGWALQGGNVQQFVGGLSSKAQATFAKQAIENKANAMAAAAGTTLPALRAQYKSNASALTQQTQYANTMQRSLNNAEAGSQQLLQLFKNKGINTSDATILNTKINDLVKNVGDSANIRAYQAALSEIGNEYAQVFARSNMATDATRQTAKDILDGNVSLGALQQSVNTIQAIGETNIKGNWQQVNNISSTIANFLKVTGQDGSQTANTQDANGSSTANPAVILSGKTSSGLSYTVTK